MIFRPWGLLDWALALTEPRSWLFVGAIGTEERCLAAWEWMRFLGKEQGHVFARIRDVTSRHSELAEERLQDRERRFREAGGNTSNVTDFALLDELYRIEDFARSIEARQLPVLFDITSLPKKFFFPILRTLYRSEAIADLAVTYTWPDSYEPTQPLSEQAEEGLHLPGFPSQAHGQEVLIISVGFLAESLQRHVGSIVKHEAIKVLIPFPAPLPTLRRTWQSVYELESARSKAKFENFRVDPIDLSGAFDRIVALGRATTASPAFAPFGPKPISAAMCLYAIQRNSAVYYPQPKVYHPDYSRGIASIDGKPAVWTYWVKHNGARLFDIPADAQGAA
jgi:hypothetical protein